LYDYLISDTGFPALERKMSELEGGGKGPTLADTEPAEFSKEPWKNENQGKKVQWWHFIIKKAFEIAIATVSVTQPVAMMSACTYGAAKGLGYLDAVFFTVLYALRGCIIGTSHSWLGSITLTAMAYSAISTAVKTYINTDLSGPRRSEYVKNIALECDTEINDSVWSAWSETRNLIPQFLKYPGIGIDKASDCLADLMVTRIIRERYRFDEYGDEGIESNACLAEGPLLPNEERRRSYKLLDEWGLLNPEITKQGEELNSKKNTRLAILSATDLLHDIYAIIYNKKIRQDKERAEEQLKQDIIEQLTTLGIDHDQDMELQVLENILTDYHAKAEDGLVRQDSGTRALLVAASKRAKNVRKEVCECDFQVPPPLPPRDLDPQSNPRVSEPGYNQSPVGYGQSPVGYGQSPGASQDHGGKNAGMGRRQRHRDTPY